MKIDVTVNVYFPAPQFEAFSATVLSKLEQIIMTESELLAELGSLNTVVDKIAAETSASLVEIATLKDLLAAQPTGVSPEITAAVAALAARLKGVDDLVADVAVPPAP